MVLQYGFLLLEYVTKKEGRVDWKREGKRLEAA